MVSDEKTKPAFEDSDGLLRHLYRTLKDDPADDRLSIPHLNPNPLYVSAVVFMLGAHCNRQSPPNQPCLILNKRSTAVRQPGDLCCPGGGISKRIDPLLARLLRLPGTPLTRWPGWRKWRRQNPQSAANLALLLAAGLREAFEEMRLNPLRIAFLGPLPPQQLAMFQRRIYPLACWVPNRQRYVVNWEVEKVVYIPLASLLDGMNYACLRLDMSDPHPNEPDHRDFLCFLHGQGASREVLWGATFRITMTFLKQVFDFTPPPLTRLPVIHNRLGPEYLTGDASHSP